MAPTTKQVRLPFEKLTEAGLKPLVKKFEKWKLKVASIDAKNKAKRESGQLLKDATFVFEDGQKMLLRVKSDGTVFQVKLNGKVVPIKHVDDMDAAVREMVDYVEQNAKAYERAKLQRERRRRIRVEKPNIITNRAEKIAKAKADRDALQASISELEKHGADLTASINAAKKRLLEADAALKAETTKTAELEAQLKKLKGAA